MSINRLKLGIILILPILTSCCVKKQTVVPAYVITTTVPDQITLLRNDFQKNVGNKVYFAFNSSAFSEEARSHLEKQANWLLNNPSVTINIDGYCDKKGSKSYNLALGLKRAEKVKQFLVHKGVDADRMTISSSGKEDMEDGVEYEESWKRRVVILNILSA